MLNMNFQYSWERKKREDFILLTDNNTWYWKVTPMSCQISQGQSWKRYIVYRHDINIIDMWHIMTQSSAIEQSWIQAKHKANHYRGVSRANHPWRIFAQIWPFIEIRIKVPLSRPVKFNLNDLLNAYVNKKLIDQMLLKYSFTKNMLK